MNKRFKTACLTTFTVGILAVVPVQASIVESLIYNVDLITNNPLVRTSSGIVSTIYTAEALMRYGSKGFSATSNTAQSKNGKVILVASAAALLAAMSGHTSKDFAGKLGLGGVLGLLYGCYVWNGKRKVDAAIESATGKTQENGTYSFVDGFDDSNIPQTMPKQDKINVWLKKNVGSFEAIKDKSNDWVSKFIEAATPGDDGALAKIDLGNFGIDPKDDAEIKKVKVFEAVRQELIDLKKSLEDLGGLLKGSGFVTALNERFGEVMGKLKITDMHDLPKEYEDVFCDSARKFQINFDGVIASLIPQFKEASKEYVEIAIKINMLIAMYYRLYDELFTQEEA